MFKFAETAQTKGALIKDAYQLCKKSYWRIVPIMLVLLALYWLAFYFGNYIAEHYGIIKNVMIKTTLSGGQTKMIPHMKILKPDLAIVFFIISIFVFSFLGILMSTYAYSTLNQIGTQKEYCLKESLALGVKKYLKIFGSYIFYFIMWLLIEAALFLSLTIVILGGAYILSLFSTHLHQTILMTGRQILGVAFVAGSILLVFYLLITSHFIIPEILFADAGPVNVFKRTLALVYKKWWRTFLLIFVSLTPALIIALVMGLFHRFEIMPLKAIEIIQAVLINLVVPFQLALLLITYFDLKIRKNQHEQ